MYLKLERGLRVLATDRLTQLRATSRIRSSVPSLQRFRKTDRLGNDSLSRKPVAIQCLPEELLAYKRR